MRKSGDPAKRAKAIVQAVTHFRNPQIIAEVSKNLGEAMVGIEISQIPQEQVLAQRKKGSAVILDKRG